VILATAGCAAALLGGGGLSYRVVPLDLDPAPKRILVGDVGGDGRLDFLAAFPDRIALLAQGREGFAPAVASPALDGASTLFDLGDVDGDGRADLVVLDEAGRVRAHGGQADGSFAPARTLVEKAPASVPRGVHDAPLLLDLEGDGDLDLALPGPAGVLLYRRSEQGTFGEAGFVATEVEVDLDVGDRRKARSRDLKESFRSRWRVPLFEVEDANGDGRLDLLAETERDFTVVLAGADGAFPREPSFRLDLEALRRRLPRLPGDRTFDPENLASAATNRVEYRREDLDGDGAIDFVVRTGNTITVFAGGEGGVRFSEPAQLLKASGNLIAIFLFDEDGDGRHDLGILRMEDVSLAEALSWFVVPVRVRFEVYLYRNRDGRTFSKKPDRRQDFVLSLPSVRRIEEEAERLFEGLGAGTARSAGDFDGDGEADDLLLVGRDGSIRIYEGAGEGIGLAGKDPVLWALESLGWRSTEDEIVVTLDTIANLAARESARVEERVAGRDPDWSDALGGDRSGSATPEVWVLDLDGDARDDAVVGWSVPEAGEEGRFLASVLLSGPPRD
jgi:hypothetical protein